MTHLSMDQLLRLREPGQEPGTAAARDHLARCAECAAELERLHQRVARLKALPALRPTRDAWPAVRARLDAERKLHWRRRITLAGLAAAAAVAFVIGAGALRPTPAEATATSAQIAEAIDRSRALEHAIDRYNPDERVLDGRTARMAAELEDRIARVDRELQILELREMERRDEELLQLWRERVGLLDALVDVHVTRAGNVGL